MADTVFTVAVGDPFPKTRKNPAFDVSLFPAQASQNPNPTPSQRHPNTNAYSFMFSIPNWVPLDPDSILKIWKAIKPYNFHTTYGNVVDTMVVRAKEGGDVRGLVLKERILQSAKIAVRRMGWKDHGLLLQEVD